MDELIHLIIESRDPRPVLPKLAACLTGGASARDEVERRVREALLTLWNYIQEKPTVATRRELTTERQARGYAFESLICILLALEGMKPSPPLRTQGEQIDGSFELDGRYFLFETKWHAAATAASDIYAFKGKLDGKLLGTIGVFLTRSFAPDAPEALRLGKALNVILFDEIDVGEALQSSISSVLRIKLRRAVSHGQVYYSMASHQDEQKLL